MGCVVTVGRRVFWDGVSGGGVLKRNVCDMSPGLSYDVDCSATSISTELHHAWSEWNGRSRIDERSSPNKERATCGSMSTFVEW